MYKQDEFLKIKGISKSFGQLKAVADIQLTIRKGEFFSILGPSGSGKTTLLRIIAGFEKPDQGRIFLNGEDITDLPPNKRKVNTIFQNYALFPHLTVWENIAFGLKVEKLNSNQTKSEVAAMLKLIQMEDQSQKKPHQLSGGQKQRVAIARALIKKPELLLLDEPLAALDLKLRQKMLIELDIIHDEVGITFLYITHDQNEAMSLSDRIAVMNQGKIEQVGSPYEIYEAPETGFVAAFIGDTNFFEGVVSKLLNDEYCIIKPEDFPEILCFNDKKLKEGNHVYLSVRPEKVHITRELPEKLEKKNYFRAKVEDIIYSGSYTKYWVSIGDYRIAILRQHSRFFLDEKPINWNEEVYIWWHADDAYMLEKYQEADEKFLSTPPEKIEKIEDNGC